ncbi:hypothetical protein HDU98_007388 [Podochytrium sp. JEL0797]|nr:hypothetical protein HDU98_007388 [Podochytrium sp. JEL0797]
MIAITSLVAFASAAMAASAPVGKYFDNYIFIIMENTDLAQVLKSPEYTAYFNQGVEFTDYHGNTHPSQPNYWATIAQSVYPNLVIPNVPDNAGEDFGAKIDGFNGDDVFNITNSLNIADTMEQAGLSWGIYSENYPGNATYCFTGQGFGTENSTAPGVEKNGKTNRLYKRKHNPFMSFTSISTNTARCGSHVFGFDAWAAAVKADTFPDYMYIVPNQVDDVHDFVADTDNQNQTSITLGVEYSAKWLAAFLDDVNKSNYLNSRRTLIHLTFDEDNSAYDHYDFPVGGGKEGSDPNCPDYNNCPADTTNNQVYGVLLGSAVSCYENTEFTGKFDHNSIVATLNDNWGLPSLGNDGSYAQGWPLQNCPVSKAYKAPAPAATNLYSGAKQVAGAAAAAVVAALVL